MVYPRSIKSLADKVAKLKLEDVLKYAKSIMEEDDELFEKAAEYLYEKYPRGCEVLYATGKIFVGGSEGDIAIALMWLKHGIDEHFQKGISKNKRVRLRYTEEEQKRLKAKKLKKGSKKKHS